MTKVIENKLEKFGAGPWLDEPDHLEFEHEGTPCIIHRNSSGAWCGYAAVPPGHPYHGKKYSDRVPCANRGELPLVSPIAALVESCKEEDGLVSLDCLVDVHGGLTYSAECGGDICHVAKPGESGDVWWFGFDCSHCDDLTPWMVKFSRERGFREDSGVYRDQRYVMDQTRKLARQLKEASAS